MSSKISASELYTVKGEQLLELEKLRDEEIAQSSNVCKGLQALLLHIKENGFRAEEASELGLIYACAALVHQNNINNPKIITIKLAGKTVDGGVNG